MRYSSTMHWRRCNVAFTSLHKQLDVLSPFGIFYFGMYLIIICSIRTFCLYKYCFQTRYITFPCLARISRNRFPFLESTFARNRTVLDEKCDMNCTLEDINNVGCLLGSHSLFCMKGLLRMNLTIHRKIKSWYRWASVHQNVPFIVKLNLYNVEHM